MPRVMEIITPLAADVLLFHGMHGNEELSRVSEYQLSLLSPKGDINLDEILGKNVTVAVGLPDDSPRYFNGYVTRFAQHAMLGRYHRYYATVRPWLWFLTRTSDCRIFQDMTVPEIIKKVFAEEPTSEIEDQLTGSYRKWTYCVQYRETDFNFVSRLMEHEGIYYYFKHTLGHNTLVLCDSYSAHAPQPPYDEIPYIAPGSLVRPELEHIDKWNFGREIQPGAYVHDDYDLERPSVELKTNKTLPRLYTPSNYEIFDYPGYYVQKADGQQYAAVRIDEFGSQFETATGASNGKGLAVGNLFTLKRHPRDEQNREYLLLAMNCDLQFSGYEAMPEESGSDFRCSFVAMSSQQQFRPRRITPKPFMQGPQTAMIVGPANDEIHTDKYGRVKVQFHWDRYGEKNENSSCWIRVSHPWAGKGWGSISIPRIGQEVIVDFLEGDPDQPIITGRVYNAESMPPFALPAGGVVSGLKSNTHKGKGFNEMSMDDTAGKEKITIHAQYDMNTKVLNDQTNTVLGKLTEEITKDTSITIKTGKLEHKVNTGTATYYVKAAVSETFDDTWTQTTKNKISIKSATNEIVVDGSTKITLVTGASKLVMEKSGAISLTGTKITIIGSDTVAVSAKKTDVSGSSEAKFGTMSQTVVTNLAKTAISGAAINASAVGMHEISGAVVKIN